MKAAVFHPALATPNNFLRIEEVPTPTLLPNHVLLRVLACGVCRTDLHIVERDLPPLAPTIIPGHQIVGEVIEIAPDVVISTGARSAERTDPRISSLPPQPLTIGSRVGVSWMGGTDGTCRFCTSGAENLCDHPTFTGYTVNGGYAEFALARADFVHPLPRDADPIHVAPLLCAGIIGFRSLRVAEVQPGDRVGLFGFGSSASLAISVLQHWNCEVYVVTRGESHRKAAAALGATWVGDEDARPPVPLDRAVTFAPAGKVVVHALSCLRKGGIVAINAIHLDQMPAFDYDTLLWGERQIRSVANMTRQDAGDFLEIAIELGIRPQVTVFSLDDANQALLAVKDETANGPSVIVP
ncbi:MAG: zinc-dependent alcohol dehydrogenase family protein [Acidobacteriaceae bacterium]|jgi:propanol-preferring alcohol dehydrogenase